MPANDILRNNVKDKLARGEVVSSMTVRLASRPGLMADYVRMGARCVSTGPDLSFLLGAAAARARLINDIKP